MNHLRRARESLDSVTTRVLRRLSYSTQTRFPTSFSDAGDSLRLRIITQGGVKRTSIIPVLHQWIEEGKRVKPNELVSLIRLLRQRRRFKHALEISEWLSDDMKQSIAPGGIAIQLDLISKVHGLEQAEKYFNSIPESVRSLELHGALLNCYAKNKCLVKAEGMFQKIRESFSVKKPLSYNVMLNLYAQLGRHEKLDALMLEMEEQGINCDSFTFNIRLNAYASTSDKEGMEKLLLKMEADPCLKLDWNIYAVAANGYLKAGLTEMSLPLLKRAEQLISDNAAKYAYETLLTLYASSGRKDEVYRVWNLYKKMGRFYNSGYICMISSLVKLDDFDGAEMIFAGWESGHTVYSADIPIVLISAYCQRDFLEKAEGHVNRIIKGGKEPHAAVWSILASGYQRNNKMEKAVAAVKKAILANSPLGMPNHLTLVACVDYLEAQGEGKAANELLKLLKDHGHDRLVNKINNRNVGESAHDRKDGSALGQIEENVELHDEEKSGFIEFNPISCT
ncbi:hypothetical protein SLE2022_050180 [Rubroshorea leprosula]